MTLTPLLRKTVLTLHIVASVGWMGAVAVFLLFALAGMLSNDPQRIAATYLMMALSTWYVIVPLSFLSPITGLLQALGTPWGMFRHYWVTAKVLITLPATALLLMHIEPIARMEDAVAQAVLTGTDLQDVRLKLAVNAGAALVALLVTTVLSVFKPQGLTPYGQHSQTARPGAPPVQARAVSGSMVMPRWVWVLSAVGIIIAVHIAGLHLAGRGLTGH